MLSIPTSLYSRLITNRTKALALCWKITRKDGTVLRFTDWPHELLVRESAAATSIQTYSPTEAMDSSARRRAAEAESINKETRGFISSGLITVTDLRAGQYDGARVDEFLVDSLQPWIGYGEHSRYYIRTVSYDRGVWRANIEGMASYLDQVTGDVWSPTCRVDLFSAKCALVATPFEKVVTVAIVGGFGVVEARKKFNVDFGTIGSLWNANGYGNDGTLIWLTGALTGITTQIKQYTYSAGNGAEVTLHMQAPGLIVLGDTATIRPGCNKKSGVEKTADGTRIAGNCKDKFSNLVNFQGEPAIPGRDKSLSGIPAH